MTTRKQHTRAVEFLKYLQRHKNDRGALANLRAALSETRRANAWPLLGGFPSAIGDRRFEIVAALWASDPESGATSGNLGSSLASMSGEHNSFESRFKRLLACDKDEIADRVVPIVRAAQAKGIRVNYTQLLADLLWWNEQVKVAWANAFWGATAAQDGQEGGLDPEGSIELDTEVKAEAST
jgi:CRISPR type I-E-associated protein CasB/Cse2